MSKTRKKTKADGVRQSHGDSTCMFAMQVDRAAHKKKDIEKFLSLLGKKNRDKLIGELLAEAAKTTKGAKNLRERLPAHLASYMRLLNFSGGLNTAKLVSINPDPWINPLFQHDTASFVELINCDGLSPPFEVGLNCSRIEPLFVGSSYNIYIQFNTSQAEAIKKINDGKIEELLQDARIIVATGKRDTVKDSRRTNKGGWAFVCDEINLAKALPEFRKARNSAEDQQLRWQNTKMMLEGRRDGLKLELDDLRKTSSPTLFVKYEKGTKVKKMAAIDELLALFDKNLQPTWEDIQAKAAEIRKKERVDRSVKSSRTRDLLDKIINDDVSLFEKGAEGRRGPSFTK